MLHELNKIDSKSVNPLKIRAYEINVWYTKKDLVNILLIIRFNYDFKSKKKKCLH